MLRKYIKNRAFFNNLLNLIKLYTKNKLHDLSALNLTQLGIDYENLTQSCSKETLKQSVQTLVAEFCKTQNLTNKSDWFLPQAIAKFSKLPLVRNDNGLISAKQLYLSEIRKNHELLGLLCLFRHSSRSDLLKNQSLPGNRNYCSLVPLVMSAFKKYENVPYSAWDPSEIHGITEPQLSIAMTYELPEYLSELDLLEIRNSSLTPKTGPKAGIMKSPLSTYIIYVPKDSGLYELPTLCKLMILQVWCAHPQNRSEYMILDPSNWDTMPEPLVSAQVFKSDDSGWDLL